MIKMKVNNQNVKLKIEGNTKAIDVVVGICRLYMSLLDNGFKKTIIDKQINEILKEMIIEKKGEENGEN